MSSFDVVLHLLTLLTREVPGAGLWLAAVKQITLLALPGPPRVSVRGSVAWPLLLSTALMGKECFKSQPKGVWLSTCDEQGFLVLLRRGESLHCTHADPQHLQALLHLLQHLTCGQGDNPVSQPIQLAFPQHSWIPIALGQLVHYSLEPNSAEILGRPAADPTAPYSWDWNRPIFLKIHSLPVREYPIWDGFFFSDLIYFPSLRLWFTLPQPLSLSLFHQQALPNSSWDVISWGEEQLSSLYYGWDRQADKWKSEHELCQVSLNREWERDAGEQKELVALDHPVWLGVWSYTGGKPFHCSWLSKSLRLPGWSELCPAHRYTASCQLCKGIQCFLLGCVVVFIFPCMHP